MKILYRILIILFLFSCIEKEDKQTSSDFRDITYMISTLEFEAIKTYIINNGDREDYSNMYCHSPHYSFEDFETYLDPEIGQANINCDPEISDFVIVIRDQNSDPQYHDLLIVRNGDIENDQIIRIVSGMGEEKVYLLKYYDYDLNTMLENVEIYINKMKNKIE